MDSDERGAGPSAALLLIIGEPFSEDHKTQILAQITKGFRCWDSEDTGISINEELAAIANRASLGEESINEATRAGRERTIQHVSDNMTVEILINPLTQSVKNSIKKVLLSPCPVKYVLHAGHVLQDTGAWVLQDDAFEFKHLAQVFKNVDVETVLKQSMEASLTIHTVAENNWGKNISKADFTNMIRIQLNPPEKQEDIHGIVQFTAYVGSFIKVVPLTNLLRASEQFGNISFSRPTLYIFPGCQGDSALFGVNGFNLLVNGGYNRRACFWDFARHLDRVDAMLLTHLGADNIFSINTVLQRKILDNIHPQIGYLYFNAPEKLLAGNISENESEKDPSLLISLAKEGTKLTAMAKELGIAPHPCCRDEKAKTTEPINLYHKLGHGSLDMYSVNPVSDGKELKDFYAQWTKQASSLGTTGPFPSQNAMSVCTLLVWKPYNLNDKIVRILFPGNAPQHKIAEGLEKMKTFDFLKHPSCTGKDLLKPVAVKKVRPSSGAASRATSARTDRSSSSRMDSRKTDSRSLKTDTKSSVTSPVKSTRTAKEKEDISKRLSKPKEVKEPRTRVAASPTKSSLDRRPMSPRKTLSPSKSPSPPKMASPSKNSPAPKSPTKSPSPAKERATSKEKTPDPVKEKTPEPMKEKTPEPVKEESPDPVKEKTPDPVKTSSNGLTDPIEEIPAAVPEPPLISFDQPESKPEADQTPRPDQGEAFMPTTNGDAMHPPKQAWLDEGQKKDLASDVDPMTGVFADSSNGFDEDEEIKPQALPDPVSQQDQHQALSSFVFANEESDFPSDHKPIEQNIQYGIKSSSARSMGALHEVDEEENEDGDADTSLNGTGEELQKDETEALEKYSKPSVPQELCDASFDPMVEWGNPMGLPSPPALDSRRSATSPAKSSASSRMDSKTTRTTTTGRSTTTTTSKAGTSRPGATASSKRAASSRASPPAAKMPPLPPVTPFFVDLTYIPNHGDSFYCDAEFFKRVRARYYVLSSLSPNPAVLDSLLEAKATWDQDDLEVTIIPTYDNDTLRHWIGLNKDKLHAAHVDVTPAVSRCTIQLQDLETSLPAYRLEV